MGQKFTKQKIDQVQLLKDVKGKDWSTVLRLLSHSNSNSKQTGNQQTEEAHSEHQKNQQACTKQASRSSEQEQINEIVRVSDPLSGLALLHFAGIEGNSKVIAMLLDAKCDIDAVDFSKHSPVGFAAAGNHVHALKLLISSKADIHRLDVHGHGPLFAASVRGHSDSVRLLLDAKANATVRDKEGISSLHHACMTNKEDVVKLLLAVDNSVIHLTDRFDHSPLYTVAVSGNVELVKCLLIAKANPRQLCNGISILDWARRCHQAEVVETLLLWE